MLIALDGENAAKLIPLALLGVLTGALGAALVVFVTGCSGTALWVGAPGPIFGVAFALTLWRRHLFGPITALLYAIAAALSYGAAVAAGGWVYLLVLAPVSYSDVREAVLSGILAGALGGGLLAAVTRLVAPIRWWPSPALAGALLGASLPLATEGIIRLAPSATTSRRAFSSSTCSGKAATVHALRSPCRGARSPDRPTHRQDFVSRSTRRAPYFR